MGLKIRIVREAGGLGDTIRILPVLREYRRRYPNADIWVYAPGFYYPIYLHSGVTFSFIPTPFGQGRRRRLAPLDASRWPYLAFPKGVTKWDLEVDEYCPGFQYELDKGYKVDKNRTQLFLEAAKLWPADPLPRYYTTPKEDAAVLAYIGEHGLKDRQLIALQPFSTDRGRDWPEEHWICLANSIQNAGHKVVILDSQNGRTRRFRQLRMLGKPLQFLASFLKYCDLLICPDSGLFHLAAAVNTPALGLFASQPGALMGKHYPLHSYLEPDRRQVKAPCPHWPCIWRRLPQCWPNKIKAPCPVLRQLPVLTVFRRALELINAS